MVTWKMIKGKEGVFRMGESEALLPWTPKTRVQRD